MKDMLTCSDNLIKCSCCAKVYFNRVLKWWCHKKDFSEIMGFIRLFGTTYQKKACTQKLTLHAAESSNCFILDCIKLQSIFSIFTFIKDNDLKFCTRSSSSCVYCTMRFKGLNVKVCKMMMLHFRTKFFICWCSTPLLLDSINTCLKAVFNAYVYVSWVTIRG